MASSKKHYADYTTIALAKHDKSDLLALYKKLNPESKLEDLRKLQKMEIVLKIAEESKPEDIENAWKSKLFSANLSVLFVRFFKPDKHGNPTNENVVGGITKISANLNKFSDLSMTAIRPKLTATPKLIKISKLANDRYLFMFASLGRKKYVPVEFEYQIYHDPNFTYCLWDNRTSVLEIRTPGNNGYYISQFSEWLKNSPLPVGEIARITLANFGRFVDALGGTVRVAKGRSRNIASELQAKELESRQDIDVRETADYKEEMEGFEIMSHGVDFMYGNTAYRVYVGLKKGNIYFKKGSVTEALLAHVQQIVTSL